MLALDINDAVDTLCLLVDYVRYLKKNTSLHGTSFCTVTVEGISLNMTIDLRQLHFANTEI